MQKNIIFLLFFCHYRDVEEEYLSPCGACRQFIAEFGLNWNVILIRGPDDYIIRSVNEILPFAFDSSKLELKRKEC